MGKGELGMRYWGKGNQTTDEMSNCVFSLFYCEILARRVYPCRWYADHSNKCEIYRKTLHMRTACKWIPKWIWNQNIYSGNLLLLSACKHSVCERVCRNWKLEMYKSLINKFIRNLPWLSGRALFSEFHLCLSVLALLGSASSFFFFFLLSRLWIHRPNTSNIETLSLKILSTKQYTWFVCFV